MARRSSVRFALSALVLPALFACSAAKSTDPAGGDGGPTVPVTGDDALDAGGDATSSPDTGTVRHAPSQHRPSASVCPLNPASKPIPTPTDPDAGPLSTDGTCTDDAQCGAADGWPGYCRAYADAGSKECNYDQCFADSDCGSTGVCSCEGQTFGWAHGSPGNTCVQSNCRTDADCGSGGYCSPTFSESCGSFYGTQGWYCHTAADECTDSSDCGNDGGAPFAPPFCVYQTEVGHWACSSSVCAG